MIKGFRLLACCLVALTLSACASGMRFTEMNPDTKPKDQDSGRIFFYRTTVLGAASVGTVAIAGRLTGPRAMAPK